MRLILTALPETPFQPPTDYPQWNPTTDELSREHSLGPSSLNINNKMAPAYPVDLAQKLQDAGWWQCPNQNTGKKVRGVPRSCDTWVNPTAVEAAKNHNNYITCPGCNFSYDLKEELPQNFQAGGQTRVGIALADQGQIGENIIAKLGEIPGYGPLVWWHPGGANSQSPLDGATPEWGIEVKTISYDATHHRFAPGGEYGEGGEYVSPRANFDRKNDAAKYLGLKGILGILVMLDYRRDVADLYLKPMPLDGWATSKGSVSYGVGSFRKNTAQKFMGEVPFENPLKDPNNPSPDGYNPMPVVNPQAADLTPYTEKEPFGPVQQETMPF